MPWRETPPPPEVAFQRLWATRNFGLLLLGGGAYVTWQAFDGWTSRHGFRSAAAVSLGITLALLGLGVLYSYLYAVVLHRNEPMTYWRDRERHTRPKIFLTIKVIAALATAGLLFALLMGATVVAGAFSAPAVFGLLLSIADLTGGIQPLFPENR